MFILDPPKLTLYITNNTMQPFCKLTFIFICILGVCISCQKPNDPHPIQPQPLRIQQLPHGLIPQILLSSAMKTGISIIGKMVINIL
jgi:hypothetical protein